LRKGGGWGCRKGIHSQAFNGGPFTKREKENCFPGLKCGKSANTGDRESKNHEKSKDPGENIDMITGGGKM